MISCGGAFYLTHSRNGRCTKLVVLRDDVNNLAVEDLICGSHCPLERTIRKDAGLECKCG